MNYYKVKKAIREYLESNNEKISDRAEARVILMSQKGYLKMMELHTMSVKKLEEIAEKLNKPVTYFFDLEEPQTYKLIENINVVEDGCPCCEKLKVEKMKLLEDLNDVNTKYRHLLENGTVKKEIPSTSSKKIG
ncbi:MAG: hypothetical protein JZU47_10840 [Prolixibacteraceae bacterium]|nr:hypothetical protein [Prolixibacteraceae bacterium]